MQSAHFHFLQKKPPLQKKGAVFKRGFIIAAEPAGWQPEPAGAAVGPAGAAAAVEQKPESVAVEPAAGPVELAVVLAAAVFEPVEFVEGWHSLAPAAQPAGLVEQHSVPVELAVGFAVDFVEP